MPAALSVLGVSARIGMRTAARKCRHRPGLSLTRVFSSCPARQQDAKDTYPRSVAGLLDWKPAEPAQDVAVHGFVRSVRSMKINSFVALGDGSSLAALQAVVPAGLADGISNGAAVRLKGVWAPSPGTGQSHELHAESVEILGPSDAKTFPIQKKYQTAEFLRTLPHLRSRLPFYALLLRLRSDVVASVGSFFAGRDYVQTHPPILTSSDCEGAGEVFAVAPAGQEAPKDGTPAVPFFRAPKYLTVSTQLHLEALAQSVGNVWTLSPTFRAEESDTPRHLSEFYMLEAEAGFVDRLDGIMDLAEDLLRAVAADLRASRVAAELLEHHSKTEGAPDLARRWQGLLDPERWPRITYTEAIERLLAAPAAFEYTPVWGEDLHTEHEKYLAQTVGGEAQTPVFVTHYPRAIKAFYMLPDEAKGGEAKGEAVECFDLLVPEFCELAGGSLREHRLAQLQRAMDARDMQAGSELDWYVDLRRWGCPPHGGFGIGFDRLLCYLSGVQTIRDTVAFPRWFGRCDC